METAIDAASRDRQPRAIARATWALTEPWAANVAAGTSRRLAFTASAYETTDPRKYAEEPAIAVIVSATRPPVHDSAVATVRPRPTQAPCRRSANATRAASGTTAAASAGWSASAGWAAGTA